MTLDGWKEIQAHLEQLSGVERTVMTLWRWSKRRRDPLPVFKRLGRAQAVAEEVTAWWQRHRLMY